jgi:oligopeptide transport system ATP-binding protein
LVVSDNQNLLEINDLKTRFHTRDGVVHAVNGVSYSMKPGETLGVVGESGCGKSVHALSIMRLIPSPPGEIESGQIWFAGRNLLELKDEEMRRLRGADLAMVFQDPMTSLNPAFTVGYQIMEALTLHLGMDKEQARDFSVELLTMVGIPDAAERLDDYPHQFSGGMRQRVMIAMGFSCSPKLLIADEPTTALDVTVQAQIVDLVKRLQEKFGMAVMWITHDLGVVADLAETINVMYAGYVVERGSVRDIYKRPRHPYTFALLGSLPRLDEEHGTRLLAIPGLPPDLIDLRPGCPFAARCPYAIERCLNETPQLEFTDGIDHHSVACWRWEEIASGAA